MSNGRILQGPPFEPTLRTSLGKFLFELGEKHGNKICQIDASIHESETYHSVKLRSTRVAIALQNRGVTSEDIIATCSQNTLDNTIPIIASLYMGAKIANLDPTLSVRHTQHLLNLTTPKIVFVQESSLGLIEKSLRDANLKCEIVVFGQSNKYATFSDLVTPKPNEDKFKPVDTDVEDTAVLFFSSGTTGLPKAICHSHQSFLKLVEVAKNLWGSDNSTIFHLTSMYWISGIMILAHSFWQGGTRIFCTDSHGENTFRLIEKYRINTIFMAPFYTYNLTSVKNPEEYDTSSLKYILTGGTPIGPEQLKRLNNTLENTIIIFGYGMTEVGLASFFNPETDQDFMKTKTGSSGKILRGTTMKIVDPDTDQLLGPNQKGEICIKSFAIMKGYYKQDSSHCFDNDGFLKTGDIGYYDEDECIYVIDRIKEMFKYQSWHIVPSSIEAVLLEHPAVKETVVFGIPRGEEGDIPAACVVLKEDCDDVDKEEIEKFVEERVSDKERLRGGITFFESLPKTPSGKPMRKEVRNIVIKSM